MLKNENKKFFLVATSSEEKKKQIKDWIHEFFSDAIIYTASDYMECLLKYKNAPPNILFVDFELGKGKAGNIIDTIIESPISRTAVIFTGTLMKSEKQNEAVAAGQLCFVEKLDSVEKFRDAVQKVEKYAFSGSNYEYVLRTLKPGEVLINEGDTTRQVYIVRKGLLKAYQKSGQNQVKILGEVHPGEFVGEMAYFNEEARMATVEAIEESELIEIHPTVFEKVIYERPSWIKMLVSTMAKRLKK